MKGGPRQLDRRPTSETPKKEKELNFCQQGCTATDLVRRGREKGKEVSSCGPRFSEKRGISAPRRGGKKGGQRSLLKKKEKSALSNHKGDYQRTRKKENLWVEGSEFGRERKDYQIADEENEKTFRGGEGIFPYKGKREQETGGSTLKVTGGGKDQNLAKEPREEGLPQGGGKSSVNNRTKRKVHTFHLAFNLKKEQRTCHDHRFQRKKKRGFCS